MAYAYLRRFTNFAGYPVNWNGRRYPTAEHCELFWSRWRPGLAYRLLLIQCSVPGYEVYGP